MSIASQKAKVLEAPDHLKFPLSLFFGDEELRFRLGEDLTPFLFLLAVRMIIV